MQTAFCRLIDQNTGREPARYHLSGGGSCTARIMAKVHRSGDGWKMSAIGEPAYGRTLRDLTPAIAPHLRPVRLQAAPPSGDARRPNGE
ncbi:TerD family protein [Streptomyces wuyuanensis]|uniref:TerD family protein n=1 Tax=Streptomyces wuyuanensis TaxID=1196353 RepID=UPI003D73C03D